tara:strand:- start:149 stop:337 length:189 start_codon:yes stop_codon:yes gene_type:complete
LAWAVRHRRDRRLTNGKIPTISIHAKVNLGEAKGKPADPRHGGAAADVPPPRPGPTGLDISS